MARIARLACSAAGLVLCLQGAAGLAGELGAGVWRWAERISVLGRLPWLTDYAVFANASLLIAGAAVLVAAARIRGR
ncbi:hypothetical protein FZ103_10940 [Streptomonospora sp. PA3]|uniref:hypothetical protein n=1 Tax=Streptomonospora sp. PA3 TaxID=2607326 RepID=UPI0012DE256B|nr:hypothetical protein [Streptomonospora sp. PA3]MUL41682.1 hypothetical protein [Streptomonospora sp. PA3]